MAGTPRVWIACLAAYNEGHLHGEWVDATDVDEMNEAGARIIKTSPALLPEELAIHDYDGFGDLPSTLGEYPSFETVARIGALIEEHGDAFIAFIDACEPDLNDPTQVSEDRFHEVFRGEWENEEDFARENVGELGLSNVPAQVNVGGRWGEEKSLNVFEELDSYLDWETIARDLFQHGPYTSVKAPNFKIYVFEPDA